MPSGTKAIGRLERASSAPENPYQPPVRSSATIDGTDKRGRLISLRALGSSNRDGVIESTDDENDEAFQIGGGSSGGGEQKAADEPPHVEDWPVVVAPEPPPPPVRRPSLPPLPPPHRRGSAPAVPLPPPSTPAANKVVNDDDDDDDGGYDYTYEDYHQRVRLSDELERLARRVWYWGPLSIEDAEKRLEGLPVGTFLVRESSNDLFYISVSFRVRPNWTLHARIDYRAGKFSFVNHAREAQFSSVEDLLEYYRTRPFVGYFGGSRGHVDVELTKPLSRLAQVRSLQYLCHFAIRQYTRASVIHRLPLPRIMNTFLQQNQS